VYEATSATPAVCYAERADREPGPDPPVWYLNDYERVYDGMLDDPFTQWGRLPSSVKVGYLHKNKDRGMNMRRFGFNDARDAESARGARGSSQR